MLFPVFSLWAALGLIQDLPPISSAVDYAHLRDGINPPTLIHSADPDYTPEAQAAGIEGSLVLQAIVDTHGHVAYASVLSPLPAGLDAKALAAVQHWRYAPATMDSEAIPVLTTIDILFRLPYQPEDLQLRQRRKAFEEIANRTSVSAPSTADVRELEALARGGLMPAVGLLGEWNMLGKGVPKNTTAGLAKLEKAAENNDARALFVTGNIKSPGGWLFTERAAFLGNADAQFAMGDKKEREDNWNEAKRYFRLCAASAHPNCQYRLGKLLVSGPGVNPNDFSQGVAWLELAKQHGDAAAGRQWEESSAKLSSLQLDWVAQLKPHLELKRFHGF